MIFPKPSQGAQGRALGGIRRVLFAVRSGVYIFLILGVAVGACAYSLRQNGIFGCSASGYASNTYLGYCGATSYGDYDHGAIWFGLEPEASAAAASAHVLFIGNSRTTFGFSSKATADWFSSFSESYYLLGFTYFENYTFEAPLLRKLHPQAKFYVINVDNFFEPSETPPGKTVMKDESARSRYEQKRKWQSIHKMTCMALEAACGHKPAIFRSRSTGDWVVTGGPFRSAPVTYDEKIDQALLTSSIALGKEFLPTLQVDRGCMMFTIIPAVGTSIGTARALADALGFNLAVPNVPGLMTFDGYHLDRESAQRWSAAFLQEAGPQIRRCLSESEQLSAGVPDAPSRTMN